MSNDGHTKGVNNNMLRSYEECEDAHVTRKEALSELAEHYVTHEEDIERFDKECWNVHSEDGLIIAMRVLDWLNH